MDIDELKKRYPGKFVPEQRLFGRINRGDRIFIGTGCGEPQYLISALMRYVEEHPKAFFDTEVMHVWTLGVAPYTKEKFRSNFRHNSFFIGDNTRDAVNQGLADYTPVHLSQVPDLFRRGLVEVDAALIQTSLPDQHGFMSLGVSVDITKAAVENARLVIAQVNPRMPRVHGDAFIHMDRVDLAIIHEEPLLEYDNNGVPDALADRIGGYVARIVNDGDTIQVGYGSIPNAILDHLGGKRDLGVHTELLSDGVVDLMRRGVVNNSRKSIDRGKTVATFCMGRAATYGYIDDHPGIEFHPLDYTNNPLVISRIENMTAINSALEIDLTGQSTAESLGRSFYSGVGGQADFMRGATLSPGGKTILVIQSTADNGAVSRIVPFLSEGAGVTLTRSDVHYVVSEYGIAYVHGKNIRERAMALIAIAHPKFRPWLIEEAKKRNLIYRDQAYMPGKRGEYPEELEAYRTTRTGMNIKLRPVKISDEPLLKDLFYSLSDNSLYRRFISTRRDMPHERLQEYVAVDFTKEMVVLAVRDLGDREEVLGLGQYGTFESAHMAEVALVVKDEFQGKGVGQQLLAYLVHLGKKQGLLGFTAEVLADNRPMMALFEKMFPGLDRTRGEDTYHLKMMFDQRTA